MTIPSSPPFPIMRYTKSQSFNLICILKWGKNGSPEKIIIKLLIRSKSGCCGRTVETGRKLFVETLVGYLRL